MFIPLHDANALKHISSPIVTRLLIAINILVYVLMFPPSFAEAANYAVLVFGFIPALVTHEAVLPEALQGVPPALTYVTYSFLHGGFSHIAMNMLFLWIFADNVEDAFGHIRFLIFYFACAAAGAFAHQIVSADPEAPLIGASGAISGVLTAYVILHPHVRLWALVAFGIPLPLPAFIPLLFWIGQQFFLLAGGMGGGVSFAAHVGGIMAGGILVLFLRRPGVPLFDRGLLGRMADARQAADAPEEARPEGPWARPEREEPPPPPPKWGR
jgi:membrane associated rhomboid family serine protease